MVAHRPISLKTISLSFFNKNCFENFSAQVQFGDRIAIIGRNGSGKSSLLNMLRGKTYPSGGKIVIPDDVTIGYVEQTICSHQNLSGGQRFNKRLTESLARRPNLLLLDEPTNHLDMANRKSLIRMLLGYSGTLIVVSHDTELLHACIDVLWHIEDNKVHPFTGSYDDYIREVGQKRRSMDKELSQLKYEKKEMHIQLMREQERAARADLKVEKVLNEENGPRLSAKLKLCSLSKLLEGRE